jgi:hypothetical protein
MSTTVLITGNVVDGFTFVGPFVDEAEALQWALDNERGGAWTLGELLNPDTLGAPDEFQEVDLDAIDDDSGRFMTPVRDPLDLIIKAENEGLDTEMEFFAYVWFLVSSGLVNSTGSNQRLVADFAMSHGEDWKTTAKDGYDSLFNSEAGR